MIEQLRAAVADGRLDPAEFDERVDAALAARTINALALLTADLIAAPGSDGALRVPLAGTPAEPAAELLTIKERYGMVRRDCPVDAAAPAGAAHRVVRRDAGPDQRGAQRARAARGDRWLRAWLQTRSFGR